MTHAVLTGPIRGTVTLVDGTVVDVKPDVVYVDSSEQAGEVAHRIALRYEDEGHPAHDADNPFVHHCTAAHCGEHARDLSDPTAALAAERAQRQTSAILDADVQAHHADALGTGASGPSMALASATAENAALNGLDGTGSTNVIPDVSLHTATPSTTGASENANSGSYARQACSWNTASGGAKTNSTSLTFATGGSVAVTHFGTWSSATYGAGNYAIGGALASSVTAASITAAGGALSLSAS
jgi:hypothetical protein